MAALSASLRLLLLAALTLTSATADDICSTCTCKDTTGADNVIITHIDCGNRNVQVSVREAISWPYQLKTNATPTGLIDISFNSNFMARIHPLPEVPIVKFTSTNNHITSIDDAAFSGPSRTIEEINLSSNRLTSSLKPHAFQGPYSPKSLQPLPKMRVLNLKRNAFHSLHPDLFEHLPVLEELYLDQNPFRIIDSVTVKAIATIINLKVLSLSRTDIKTLPDTFLHTPRFLEFLDISFNEMTAVPTTIGEARELRTLILDGNPIWNFHNGSMPYLPKLSNLSISMMPYLTSIEDGAFSGLTGLQEFHCQLNPNLGLIDTYAMGDNLEARETYLTTLILNNNHLTHLSRHMVLQWHRLRQVTLYGNPWICDCTNQWMVTDLVPILEGIDPTMSKVMMCHQPPEMLGKSMYDVEMHFPHMRCLDEYGNRPENDGAMLVGVLIGSLLAIPISLSLYFIWIKRRMIFQTCFPEAGSSASSAGPGAADFSRAFYKRANLNSGGEF